jgi:hypothetical protein
MLPSRQSCHCVVGYLLVFIIIKIVGGGGSFWKWKVGNYVPNHMPHCNSLEGNAGGL